MPDYEWQRRRTLVDTIRLIRDFIAGGLALAGLIALLFWLFVLWNPAS